MYSVQVDDLTKVYKGGLSRMNVVALKNFNLSVSEGTIFGLLGPNGAGKTTLIKILLGITFPTAGNASILGSSIGDYRIKSKVGYLPENHKFPPYLTAEQLLKFVASLSGYNDKSLNKRIDELLSLVKMTKWKRTKIKKYSKGMMQRIGLAQALINDPQLIFLDEPTDGVDPIGRKEIRDILNELKSRGKTIFVNSHLLSEVELISDRVAILNKGEMILEGTVEDITTNKEVYRISFAEKLPQNLIDNDLVSYSPNLIENNTYSVKVSDLESLNGLLDKLRGHGLIISSLLPQKSSLEEMFISLIKESDEKSKQ